MSEQNELDGGVLEARALGVEPVSPPPGLRARILSAASMPAPRRAPIGWPRVPLTAMAAAVAIALLAGLLIGRTTAPPPMPSVAHFTVSGHGPFQGVSAKVVDLKADGVALVTFEGVPAAPADKVYELWLITPGGKAVRAGVFTPDATGSAVVVVDQSLDGFKLMAVTVEGRPGVDAPTQQPQIYGTVA